MTDGEMIERLAEMRHAGPLDVMTRIFGLLFHDELPRGRAARLARMYTKKWESDPKQYPLAPHKKNLNGVPISDAARLADYVTVRPEIARKWRPA